MLTNLLLLILNFAGGFLSLMLLARFFMQWQRVSFHNQLGQFVIATTDWCVRSRHGQPAAGMGGADDSCVCRAGHRWRRAE